MSPLKKKWLQAFANCDEMTIASYEAANARISRRSAQHQLRALIREGCVEMQGRSKAAYYRLTAAGRAVIGSAQPPPCASASAPPPAAAMPLPSLPPANFPPGIALPHEPTTPREPAPQSAPQPPPVLPFAADAVRQSLQFLCLPQMLRPVRGHRAEFLRAYGTSCPGYLDEDARMRLLALGWDSGGLPKVADGSTFTPESWKRLTDLCWNSCRLQGSRLSRDEAASILAQTEPLQETPSREKLMLLNHKNAVWQMITSPEMRTPDRQTIFKLHSLLTAGLLHASSEEGRLRDKPRMIPGTSYVPLADAEKIAAELDLLLAKAAAIENPYERSLFLLVQLSYLHPFAEGNGCVARMAANIPLLNACLTSPDTRVPPATLLTFVDVLQRDYDLAMRAVCELNDVTLIGNLFQHACWRACAPPAAVIANHMSGA